MQLSLFLYVAQCQLRPLKVWLHRARGCNHLHTPVTAFMFGCSAVHKFTTEGSGQPWDNDRGSWSRLKRALHTVASPWEGMGGSGPPTSVQTPPEIRANPLKRVLYIGGGGGVPCMYIVIFYCSPAKKNCSDPPHFFWAGDATDFIGGRP